MERSFHNAGGGGVATTEKALSLVASFQASVGGGTQRKASDIDRSVQEGSYRKRHGIRYCSPELCTALFIGRSQ